MIGKIVTWWRSCTLNEKMMYAILAMLVIGIATRWEYVMNDISEAFTSLFNR